MDPVKIILADDHALVRKGIKRIIQEDPGLTVIDEAEDGLELLNELEKSAPDLVILDISMPRLSGLEAAKFINDLYPQLKILFLTMHRDRDLFHKAMEIGAAGYVLKDELDHDLHQAIKTVLQGKTYVSPLLFK
jgi:DNA-binding NarL/FixJ family response regulator